MFLKNEHLQRRTFLRGLGGAIALPMLDAMMPAVGAAAAVTASPTRLVFTYMPIGTTMAQWLPKTTGRDYEMTRILKPLEPFRQDFSVLSGLDHANAEALGDGPGDHARAGACFLTGVHPRKTAGSDIQVGTSVDQIAAQQIGSRTRLASLELGCEDTRVVGACDSGYSCAYQNSVSWRNASSPMLPEINPRAVFERLFGSDDLKLSPEDKQRRLRSRRSILDLASEDTQRLNGKLGAADRRKVDEYLYSVREVEKQIESAEKQDNAFVPSIDKPAGVPILFADYLKLMFDMQVLAMQADQSRVFSFMIGREGSLRTYGEIGVPEPHHPLTHHRNNPDSIEKVTKISTFHATQFAYFLQRLKDTKDGDGNLLDHSMIVYGSAIADGNAHSHNNLPVLLAGHGGGALKPGSHVQYKPGTPMTNLYLSLLDVVGVQQDKIGDSTGRLNYLSDIS